ncbi:hypothetical protein ACFY3U_22640 [Micromonospora sp. NPDC000089]|uniref:hypothetical protein n=1 Tax=unclassified Micromonospora TaxID=2617518 RepID=UPI0036C2917F
MSHLQRQATQLLSALKLPASFTFAQLHDRIEQRRGRPVNLIPRHLPALAPHGLWVAGALADYVFYDASASKVRQSLIIGHEYGHMMFDDVALPNDLECSAATLMPSMDPSVAEIALGRLAYDEPIERRAEVFGTVAVQRAESWSAIPTSTPADPHVSARLVATLEGRAA